MTGARIRATLLAVLVTGVMVYGVLALAGPDALIDSLRQARPEPLAGALLLVPLVHWLRAWRFGLLMTGRPDLPEALLIRTSILLNLFNFLLPFRVGEASFPILMKRGYGMDYSRAAGILILVRLMDGCCVAALLCLAAAAIPTASPVWGLGRAAIIVAGLLALAGFMALPHLGGALRGGTGRLLSRHSRLATVADGLISGGTRLQGASGHGAMLALTLAIWAGLTAIAVLAIAAIDPAIGFAPAVAASASSNLAFALPVTGIAGLGPAQAAWATALSLSGTPWQTAIASALAGYAVLLTGTLVLGGLALLLPSGRASTDI